MIQPYTVERHDADDGSIVYEVWDYRPESYRMMCAIAEGDYKDEDRGRAKQDADMVARALNLMTQKDAAYGPS